MNTDSTHTLPPFLDPRTSQYDMYQQLPYVKNVELCTPDMIKLISGNVVKYYMIISLPDTITINTNPIAEFLVEQGKRASLRYHSHIVPKPEDIIDAKESFQPGIAPVSLSTEDLTPEALTREESASVSSEEPEDILLPEDTSFPVEEAGLTNPFVDISEDDDDFSFLRG